SVNFNALVLDYGVQEQGLIYVGAIAVDNIVTAVWMAVGLVLPRALGWRADAVGERGDARAEARAEARDEQRGDAAAEARGVTGDAGGREPVGVYDLATMLTLGLLAVWGARQLAALWEARLGGAMPSILVLTVLALILAQLSWVRALVGARALGLLAVQVFLAVIGVYCDLGAFLRLGALGPTLALFACTVVCVHGIVTYGCAWLLRVDLAVAAVASQANIGGGTSAMALARSLGRGQLVLPAIVVGALGTALGTFLGFLVAERLL
ncbi:MAG: DUF819 family protein, partial [Myxococcales bacterium]|nr:DUF819 family protein [Myxococcales bacterium]